MSTHAGTAERMNCDWCGLPFVDGERRCAGYEDEPTHKDCLREARRAYREDQNLKHGEPQELEREPFNDWPNGMGTYD